MLKENITTQPQYNKKNLQELSDHEIPPSFCSAHQFQRHYFVEALFLEIPYMYSTNQLHQEIGTYQSLKHSKTNSYTFQANQVFKKTRAKQISAKTNEWSTNEFLQEYQKKTNKIKQLDQF